MEELNQYEQDTLEKIRQNDLFEYIENTKYDPLGDFVDRVIERSLYIYNNKNCHTCDRLLSSGKSSNYCPKHKTKIY
jgi:hypothetical protein